MFIIIFLLSRSENIATNSHDITDTRSNESALFDDPTTFFIRNIFCLKCRSLCIIVLLCLNVNHIFGHLIKFSSEIHNHSGPFLRNHQDKKNHIIILLFQNVLHTSEQ